MVKNGVSFVTELSSYLSKKLNRDLLTPQVQVAIRRLEQRELVVMLREEKSEKGGRPRKLYGLTPLGREMVEVGQYSLDRQQAFEGVLQT